MFAAEIRRNRVSRMRANSNWQWQLELVFVKINCETQYLWTALDHEGEVLESYVAKRRDRKVALRLIRKSMKRYGSLEVIVTDELRRPWRCNESHRHRPAAKPATKPRRQCRVQNSSARPKF